MEFRVLRYFLTVAREASITGAANSLHLTQPTLSRQLQELEKAEFKSINEIVGGDIYIGCGETEAMKYVTQIMKELQDEYPAVKFHIYSGNAEDVTEKLDKGLLDFGILIQPIDLSKYDNITIPHKDVWGVIMRNDSPLASKEAITIEEIKDRPIIASRQMSKKYSAASGFLDWFGNDFENLNIVATYNLIYNAAIMVQEGIGYAITLDKLVNTTGNTSLCFRPLSPKLESGLDVVWKKYQLFSPAAKIFLDKINKKFV